MAMITELSETNFRHINTWIAMWCNEPTGEVTTR